MGTSRRELRMSATSRHGRVVGAIVHDANGGFSGGGPLTTLVKYTPMDCELDLTCLSPADYELITSLHRHIDRGDGILICLQPGGGNGEMYVKKIGSNYFAAHFPGGAHGEHPIFAESPAHLREKEYWARSARDAGFHAEIEFPVRRGKLDVAITGGPVATDIEIQRSDITARLAKARTTRYSKAGFLPVWFNDSGGRRLPWLREVPAMGCTARSWEVLPRARTVLATGLTSFQPAKCAVGTFEHCPETHKNTCGRFHPLIGPWHGLHVDDVAAMLPAGEIVPLRARRGIVYLVSRESFACYRELTGGLGEWLPSQRLSISVPANRPAEPAECLNPRHESAFSPVHDAWKACGMCGGGPVGPGGVLCVDCKELLEARVALIRAGGVNPS